MKDFIIKTSILIGAVAIVLLVWFGLRTIDHQAAEIEDLRQTIESQSNQVSFLEDSVQSNDPYVKESENLKIEESVSVFVQSFFDVRRGNLDERKKNAEVILTQDMFERYFTNNDETLLYENHLGSDVRIYTRVNEERASAIVVFDNTMVSLTNGNRDRYRTTLEVFLEKDGSRWLINRFEQLMAEPI